jgi:TM2 domain-containing membrane protein YozV
MSSRIVAALLAFFLGTFGVHKFYLGDTKWGIIYIVATVLTFGIISGLASLWDTIKLAFLTSDEDFAQAYGK